MIGNQIWGNFLLNEMMNDDMYYLYPNEIIMIWLLLLLIYAKSQLIRKKIRENVIFTMDDKHLYIYKLITASNNCKFSVKTTYLAPNEINI